MNLNLKTHIWKLSWRAGSAVESTGCSSIELRFESQHPHSLQPFVTCFRRSNALLCLPQASGMHVVPSHTFRKKTTHTHNKTFLKRKKKYQKTPEEPCTPPFARWWSPTPCCLHALCTQRTAVTAGFAECSLRKSSSSPAAMLSSAPVLFQLMSSESGDTSLQPSSTVSARRAVPLLQMQGWRYSESKRGAPCPDISAAMRLRNTARHSYPRAREGASGSKRGVAKRESSGLRTLET